MIELIVGSKGSEKTKKMVDIINNVVKTTKGNVVCIEKSMSLTHELDHKCRLIDLDEYKIHGYDVFYGFVSGILASNYDIVEVFVDGILKVGNQNLDGLAVLLAQLNELGGSNIKFTITVSTDMAALPESVKKYL